MEAAEQADQEPPGGVVAAEVEQLVEDHLVVHRALRREGQHGTEHPADKGRGEAGDRHGPAGPAAVCGRHPADLGPVGLGALAEGQPKPQIGEGVPQQQRRRARQIEEIEQVGGRCRTAQPQGQRDGGEDPGEGIVSGEGGLGTLHPQGPVEQGVPPAPTGGEQQDQRQHPPHAELPPGGELIPKKGLDGQQQRRRTGGGEGLEEKGPEIGHRAQTSISSNSFLSRSRSWGEMGSSFRKAATRSPAEPW